jgi:hypothetical protein
VTPDLVMRYPGLFGKACRTPVERTSSGVAPVSALRRRRSRRRAFPGEGHPLFPVRQIARNDTKCCPFHRSSPVERSQVYPERRARIGIEQLGLSGFHARGCEAHERVGPPVTDDGISNQHAAVHEPLPEAL